MAIFNMIGGGASIELTWKEVASFDRTPYTNSYEYLGYYEASAGTYCPAIIVTVWNNMPYFLYYNESFGQTSYIATYNFQVSSTSYSGMSPLPSYAPPVASGSIYYINIPSGTYAGTWSFVVTSNNTFLYKLVPSEDLELKTATYTVSQSSVSTIGFDVAAIPSSYWVVLTNPTTASPPTRHVWSVAYDSNTDSAPIFTYVYSTLQKGGTSSNVSIVNQKLQFSTSGIATSLYFPRGTWTLYYIE